ncbi:enolase 4 isoform X2 [Callorhinchus milii]|uniref:enolase 4 isoform X2 n=1 Tax=Callorhinchus milii TaxID=7868 RepID=UPI0004575EAC|nr:enolase 4 isoform X2 [Callorhinchus milii]|eukprot:gi/632970676/ref/XP_007901784.1/ PREDICTED: enolase-like protein ENO4 isoform X2 [Callorhinchus milii]
MAAQSPAGFVPYGRRTPREARERHELKQQAAEYYRGNQVVQEMQKVLNSMFSQKPGDVFGHLSICTATLPSFCTALSPTSSDTGEASNEKKYESARIALEWINDPLNSMLTGILPDNQAQIDKQLSEYFKQKLEEYEEQKKNEPEPVVVEEHDVTPIPVVSSSLSKKKKALKRKKSVAVEKPITPFEPPELVLPGSVAFGAVSLVFAKTVAKLKNIPLYMYMSTMNQQESPKEMRIPIPMISLFNCGISSGGKLCLIKEMIGVPKPGLSFKQGLKMMIDLHQKILMLSIPPQRNLREVLSSAGCVLKACDRLEQPFEIIEEACTALELTLGEDFHLIINCAAHELMDYTKEKYEIMSGVLKHPDEMMEVYENLIAKYPSIIGLIDPLRKEDVEQWISLCSAFSSQCYLIADVASKSMVKLTAEQNLNGVNSTCLVLKYANQCTLTDLTEVTKVIEEQDRRFIIGCTEGETADDSLADIAVALGASLIKLGGLHHGERVAKYNRLLAIEEELAHRGALGRVSKHQFPVVAKEIPEPEAEPES